MSATASDQVVVDGKKYACETCIKGHRSSACKHTDRPLFEIKRKGRPVTQCEHCRELRKTKQVHVKCICETREEDPGEGPGSKKGVFASIPGCIKELTNKAISHPFLSCSGGKKVQATAAFPNGLPPELEAMVASQLGSEGSSDSDHGGTHLPSPSSD
ncbi:copper-fist-domain-containing protein [Heliocybe sulcata]|uniref:Copper-fist-domain-containing protein n=1 Tax=Heliocybe sulcata TaxID=5364 RepID=A0A5C3N836_9AGAM|nr:copper-fist-domain-containing protein [Heliocybe sulcata]